MRAVYEDRRRSQIHRPPQTFGTDRYAQKHFPLDERSYCRPYNAPSDISSQVSWTCDGDSEVSEPESVASPAEVEELHVNPNNGYLLQVVVVATLVIIFLFEIPLRLPYFLALFFDVPSLHMMFTLVFSKKSPHFHIEELEDSDCESVVSSKQEALYRRSSDEASDSSSLPSASSPTPQAILQATPQTLPWFTSFIPWTMNGRKNLFTDYTESHFQPCRTYREAFSDTIPRVAKSTFECAYSFLRFQLRFRAFLTTVQNTCAFVTGREVDAEEYLDDIVRFYVDWIVGIGGLLWLVVRMMLEDAVRGLRGLGGLLWVWVVRYENGGVPIAKTKVRMTVARTPFRSTQQPLVSVIRRE